MLSSFCRFIFCFLYYFTFLCSYHIEKSNKQLFQVLISEEKSIWKDFIFYERAKDMPFIILKPIEPISSFDLDISELSFEYFYLFIIYIFFKVLWMTLFFCVELLLAIYPQT